MTDIDNIKSINTAMIEAISRLHSLATDAAKGWNLQNATLSDLQKLAFWQNELDMAECMLFQFLIKAGVTRFWQYAAMSETAFEATVTNRTNRLTIEMIMASKGLVRGVEFSEEILRTLQGRPQDILADPRLCKLASMKLKDFVHKHKGDFNAFEQRMLGKLPRTVLWAIVRSEILEDMIDEALESGLQSGGSIAASFFKSIEKRGLWQEFKPTQIEKPYIDALRI